VYGVGNATKPSNPVMKLTLVTLLILIYLLILLNSGSNNPAYSVHRLALVTLFALLTLQEIATLMIVITLMILMILKGLSTVMRVTSRLTSGHSMRCCL
jgi:hypothetical protein